MPAPWASFLIVLNLSAALAAAVYALSEPAAQWIRDAPQALRKIEYQLNAFDSSVEDMQEASEQVEKLSRMGDDSEPIEVEVRDQDSELAGLIFRHAGNALRGAALTLLILFFLLGWGPLFFRDLIGALPNFGSQRRMVEMVWKMRRSVAAYFATVTLINAVLGIAVAAATFALGLPNAALWGVLAGVLNFLPYIGPLLTAAVLFLAALLTFPTLSGALFPPAVFLLLNAIESQIVTPLVVGRRLQINPLVIFMAVLFWFALWGPVGVLFTVPFLLCARVVLDGFGTTRGLSLAMGK